MGWALLGSKSQRGSGEETLSSLDPFQGRPVATYLMLGTFQRKVLFNEYTTCNQREVWVVRTYVGVFPGSKEGRGPNAHEALGCRGSLQRVSQTLLELYDLNCITAALALCLHPCSSRSTGVCPLLSPHLELLVTGEAFPGSLAMQTPLSSLSPFPCHIVPGHTSLPPSDSCMGFSLRVSTSLKDKLQAPALPSSLGAWPSPRRGPGHLVDIL